MRQAIRQRLGLTSRKAVYVYIHGFNNTFEDGVFVIAQLWHFLGRQGVPMLYTWPAGAGGGLRGYTRDRESGRVHRLPPETVFARAGFDCQKWNRCTSLPTAAVPMC